jgi:hypothetical protein
MMKENHRLAKEQALRYWFLVGRDSISGGNNYKYLTKLFRLLNYLGCKALGLQEYHHVLNETRKFVFPQDFPYSNGYELYREVTVRTMKVNGF